METKIVQVILLGLLFHKVAATEIFPSDKLGDFIIGKDATHPALVPEIPPRILEEGILEIEDKVSNDWNNLLGGVIININNK